ncbi:hypothetical protein CHARACLAT_033091 [Characodon lateralis]|uniref:Uncharacterized protein n=1 Tax=Characodon lateralis TaxID=208331 RepID=A0ABU7E6Z4_9TELE|nr:hypothetical protein [Characodon lateralis]
MLQLPDLSLVAVYLALQAFNLLLVVIDFFQVVLLQCSQLLLLFAPYVCGWMDRRDHMHTQKQERKPKIRFFIFNPPHYWYKSKTYLKYISSSAACFFPMAPPASLMEPPPPPPFPAPLPSSPNCNRVTHLFKA